MKNIKERLVDLPEVINFIWFVAIGAVVTFLTNNFFSIFAPFIIAYVVTRMLYPLMKAMKTKLKLPNLLSTLLCMFIFAVIAGLVSWVACYFIIEGIKYIIGLLTSSHVITNVIIIAKSIGDKCESLLSFLNVDISMDKIIAAASDAISQIVTALSDFSINLIVELPTLLIAFIIGCIAAFYMLNDYDKLGSAITRQLSPKTLKFVEVFNNKVLFSLIKMVLSYALISAICCVELLLGFWILGIKDAAFIAFLVAVFDVLPVLGSGGILVPWGVVAILMGDPFKGIGLIILWIIIVIVRQILEPKIVGSQIGLHPLVTVAALFIGLKLMGAIGMIVAPLYILICKELNAEGVIHLYKSADQELPLEDDADNENDHTSE